MASTERLTPPELAVAVSRMLAAAGIPHAVGGALALGFYAEPRGTYDVDLNIFVDADDPHAVLDVLRAGGVEVDSGAARTIAERGDLFVDHGGCRLDLFFSSIPMQHRAAQRTRQVDLLGTSVPILSAEDLIALKLLFNRHKDIVDIEHLVAAVGGELDGAYIRTALVECVGEDDIRMATVERLIGNVSSS